MPEGSSSPTMQSASAAAAAATATPTATLSTAAIVILAAWAVFGVLLDTYWPPITSTVAAIVILWWRFTPGSLAESIHTPAGQYVLALVIAAGTAVWLLEDAGVLVRSFSTNVVWWLGLVANAVAGFLAWSAMSRMKA